MVFNERVGKARGRKRGATVSQMPLAFAIDSEEDAPVKKGRASTILANIFGG